MTNLKKALHRNKFISTHLRDNIKADSGYISQFATIHLPVNQQLPQLIIVDLHGRFSIHHKIYKHYTTSDTKFQDNLTKT